MSKKLKYLVLQAIGLGGDHCPRGSHVELSEEDALNIGYDYVQLVEGQEVSKQVAPVIVEESPKETEVAEIVETEEETVEEEGESEEVSEETSIEESPKETEVAKPPKKGRK